MGNYLKQSRHGTVFYFRRRVPDDLRPLIGKPYLVKSLGTGERLQTIIRARFLASQTENYFVTLRDMASRKKSSPDGFRIDFALSWDYDPLGNKKAVARDILPGEEVAAAISVATPPGPSRRRTSSSRAASSHTSTYGQAGGKDYHPGLGGACNIFCVNGHPAGNCHIARSDDDRRQESSTQGVTGQPVG